MLHFLKPKVKKLKLLNLNIQFGFSNKYYIYNNIKNNNKIILSFYLLELFEKQKLKFTFSLSEKIIKKYILFIQKYYYKRFNLSNIFELRLDNILFKLGYSNTILQARQWIIHGHFFINFKLIRNPGFLIKKGDIINISLRSYYIFNICKKNLYKKYIKNYNIYPHFIICNKTLLSIIYSIIDIYYNINEYNNILVVNFYSH